MKRAPSVPWSLALAVLVYVVLRLLVLHTAFDRTAMPMYELFPMGTMAELARENVELPLAYFYDNAAGQILFGYVTRPFFALFGPNYLALKLVPFVLGLATLVLVWRFLRSNFGTHAAAIGAFLFALAPTTLFKYSMMNSGNHFENLFFVTLAMVCGYRFLRDSDSRRWLFASGFTAGFALFVFLGALIPIGLLAGLHVGTRGLRRSLRDLPLALFGFALGIAPLVAVNLATGARGLGFLAAKFDDPAANEHTAVVPRAFEFMTRHLFDSTAYEDLGGVDGRVFGLLFLCAFAAAYIVTLPAFARGISSLARGLLGNAEAQNTRFERAKVVPLVLYLPLAALAYGLSNFRIGGHGGMLVVAGYRYFLPHLLFAVCLIAIVSARAIEHGGVARILGSLLGGVAIACGASNLAIVDWTFSKPGLGTHYAGYNLAQVGRALIAGRNALSQAEIVAHIEAFPPLLRHRVSTSIGFNRGTLLIEEFRDGTASKPADPAWRLDLPRLLDGFPTAVHVDLARGQGIAVRFALGGDVAEMERVLQAVVHDAPDLGPCVVEGCCLPPGTEPLESKTAALLGTDAALRDATNGALRASVMRGAGLLVGRLAVRDIESERELLDEWIDASAGSADFFVGLGQGLVDGGDVPRSPETLRRRIAAADLAEAWRGFGVGMARVLEEPDGERAFARFTPKALDETARGAFLDGFGWSHYPRR